MYDLNPELRPKVEGTYTPSHQITLADEQMAQIKEIFDLFDTDGGGTIDRKELDFALVALGFANKKPGAQDLDGKSELMDSIVADGTVTYEEFCALMKGELSGRDPMEEVREIFTTLTTEEIVSEHANRITFSKLKRACKKFHVKLSDEELAMMIAEADVDGGGTVDEKEFVKIMNMSAWF